MLTKKIKDERAFCIIFYFKKRKQILYCPSSKKNKNKERVKGCFSIFIMVSCYNLFELGANQSFKIY